MIYISSYVRHKGKGMIFANSYIATTENANKVYQSAEWWIRYFTGYNSETHMLVQGFDIFGLSIATRHNL